jgi:hypothetical protein
LLIDVNTNGRKKHASLATNAACIEIIQPGHRQIDSQINTDASRDHPMGTLHRFPAIPKTTRDPHFRDLSQTIPDFVRQFESFQKLVEGSLSVALVRLQMH